MSDEEVNLINAGDGVYVKADKLKTYIKYVLDLADSDTKQELEWLLTADKQDVINFINDFEVDHV